MKLTRCFVTAASAFVLIASVYACSSSTTPSTGTADAGGAHSSPYPTCDAIIKQCHPFDVEEGPIHDCHDLGHAAQSDAPCIEKRDECFRICVADAGVDAAHEHDD